MYLAYIRDDFKCRTELLEQNDDKSGLVDDGERDLDEQHDEEKGLNEQEGGDDVGFTRYEHLSS